MSRFGSFGTRLYKGEVSYDIVGRRRRWYALSAIILIVAISGLGFRGLNLGIEFKGGAEFGIPASNCTITTARTAMSAANVEGAVVTQLGNNSIRIRTGALSPPQSNNVLTELATTCGVPKDNIKVQLVGPSWGSEITKKALLGLVVFLIAVSLFLSIYFDWRMALAALVALIHDLVITIGIYALVGFEVTPATVIGVLTILGFSLYDTVVVFDKVKENTRGISSQSRYTFSEAANLALNQTLVRSINTSVVAILPVAAILFVGAGLLGAGTLKDLALALFVGTTAGLYSSLFVATPFLCQIREREPAMKALAARVAARRSGLEQKQAGRKSKKVTVVSGGAASAKGGAVGPNDVGGSGGIGGDSVGDVVGDFGEVAAVAVVATEAAQPTRPHRQQGPRYQPKRASRKKRGK